MYEALIFNKTKYDSLSRGELNALFDTDTWNSLTPDDRLAACKELGYRYAKDNNVQPCNIATEYMNDGCYGYYNGALMVLNRSLLEDGKFVTRSYDSNGNPVDTETTLPAPGWQIYNTVIHEGTHHVQNQNNPNMLNGAYVDASTDFSLYRIQSMEKEAFKAGDSKSYAAMVMNEARLKFNEGKANPEDPQHQEFVDAMYKVDFHSHLKQAASKYNDPNIEATLNQVIADRTNGTTQPNPSPSYQYINALLDAQNQPNTTSGTTSGAPGQGQTQGVNNQTPRRMQSDASSDNSRNAPSGQVRAATTPETSQQNPGNAEPGLSEGPMSQKSGSLDLADDGMHIDLTAPFVNNQLSNDQDDGMHIDLTAPFADNQASNHQNDGMHIDLSAAFANNQTSNDQDDGMHIDLTAPSANNQTSYDQDDGMTSQSENAGYIPEYDPDDNNTHSHSNGPDSGQDNNGPDNTGGMDADD